MSNFIKRDASFILKGIDFTIDGVSTSVSNVSQSRIWINSLSTGKIVLPPIIPSLGGAGIYSYFRSGDLKDIPIGPYQVVFSGFVATSDGIYDPQIIYGEPFQIVWGDDEATIFQEVKDSNAYIFAPDRFLIEKSYIKKPETWFRESDTYLYTNSGLDVFNIIPSGITYYCFPYEPVWSNASFYSGLLHYYQNKAIVGVNVPVQYINTNISDFYGGAVQEVYTTLSGIGSFQISTSGQAIYIDDNKVIYDFWNTTNRQIYNSIINKYASSITSGVDFLFHRDYSDFTTQLRNNEGDTPNPLLNWEKFGWRGDKPWQDWKWNWGHHIHLQSGVSSVDLIDSINTWTWRDYNGFNIFNNTAAAQISGLIFQDNQWDTGEIWEYIQYIRSIPHKVYTTFAYNRNCPDDLCTLGKAICLMADCIFGPGEANYSLNYNYTQSQYNKIPIGNATSSPHLIGDSSIFRSFENGHVIIYDDGAPTASIIVYN